MKTALMERYERETGFSSLDSIEAYEESFDVHSESFVAWLEAQLTTPRQFRAKIQFWDEMEDKEDCPVANEDGWVTGWYADGIMVGKAIECDEDGVIFEWWTYVDPESVEAVCN